MIARARRRPFVAFVILVALALLAPIAGSAAARSGQGPNTNGRTIDIQILQYSDWHGAIADAPTLGAYFAQDEAANPNTLIITGGDDFGGTEPVSNLNDDIPAILVQNLFGTDVAGLGNHNFDGGIANLQEKIDLADYPYISSNLANVDDELDGVEPYVIFEFEPQIKVAVIGYTNEEAPTLVFPGNFGSIEVTDAADALQAARDQAEAEGADIFIAVGHKGVRSFDSNGNPQGELIDLANALEGFDMVLGDHTDIQYTGVINGAIVAEAESNGDTYNRITLTVKPGSGKIVATNVETVDPDPAAITPRADIEALTAPYFESLAAAFDGVIATTDGFWPRASSGYERRGESELGNLFADAMLAGTPGADIAFTNSGGIRNTLPSSYIVADPTVDRDGVFPDDIVLGDVFAIHNFGNLVTTQQVTGAQLHAIFEFGVDGLPAGKFPQIAGFQVIYDTSQPLGSHVISMTLDDGTPITNDDAQTFTMATNNFISTGGDGYEDLTNDPDFVTRDLLTSVIADYISDQGTITPTFDCRMVDQNPAGPATTRAVNPLGPLATRADCTP